jgi:AraC family transcriptional regulator, exoenzyme S synthesis regulatory protein ExsA
MANENINIGGIIYSTYTETSWSGEQFLDNHLLAYIVAGNFQVVDGNVTHTLNAGDATLFRKNNLARFIKNPPSNGALLSVTVVLDKDTLLDFSNEQQQVASPRQPAVVHPISPDVLLKNYFDSLMPFFNEPVDASLVRLKIREAVFLLLHCDPALKDVLFDFGIPGRIDLEAFMHRNFRYNVPMEKLAYLTGRSLATFKRDFTKVFNLSPSRWIQQQRLKEARYLIAEKKMKPSDVYLQVGFESLSHFSYSFKQFFGVNPSAI